ncbi:MAG: hypothetical protein C0506_13965 [Anaerolinea sp.]|nr:hypothetical protein [Anaerolinea sp.]
MNLKPGIEVGIRLFQPSDQDRIRWLFARTPPWGRTYLAPQPLPGDLEDISANYPTGCFVATEVVENGEEAVVGLAAVATVTTAGEPELPRALITGEPVARLHWVSVAPERWRLGLGRRLTEAAIDWARKSGSRTLVLETSAQQAGAIALYEAMGFVERCRTMEGEYELVWFVLALAAADDVESRE